MLKRPRHALAVAILTIAIVGVRVHENVPFVHYVRPVALIAYGGLLVLLLESSLVTIMRVKDDRAIRLVLVYFGWAVVTAPIALYPGLAVGSIVILTPIVITCAAIMLFSPDRRTLDRCLVGLVVAIVLLGVATLVRPDQGERLSGSGTFDPNDLAAVAALGFPFALGLVGRGSKRVKLVGMVAAGVCPLVVIATASRGGTLAIVVGSIVYALGLKGKRAVLVLAALIGIGALGWVRAPDTFRNRITALSSLDDDYNATEYTGRQQIWARGIKYTLEHPIAGVGLMNFPIAEGDYASRIGMRTKWSAPHNMYLQAFAELGVVGGGLFLAIFGVSLKRAARLWRHKGAASRYHRPELLAGLVSFGVSGYFLSHAYFGLFFALVALTAVATKVAASESKAPAGGSIPASLQHSAQLVRRRRVMHA